MSVGFTLIIYVVGNVGRQSLSRDRALLSRDSDRQTLPSFERNLNRQQVFEEYVKDFLHGCASFVSLKCSVTSANICQ